MSDIQRITLISDPTNDFPKNANNIFKVRLPERLTLPGRSIACLVVVHVRTGSWTEQWRDRDGSSYPSRQIQRDVFDAKIHQRGVLTGQFQTKEYVVELEDIMSATHPVTSGNLFWKRLMQEVTM